MQIGLAAWIIQDGNYPDFEVGQKTSFALEFYALDAKPSSPTLKACNPITPANYDFAGTVVFSTADVWVIDCGFLAYTENKPPLFASRGSAVRGEFYLGVDPFFYFESLCRLPGMPELRYRWHIKSILLETTPWLRAPDDTGREVIQRDASRLSHRSIERTDAWHDDGGNGHYILDCGLI